MRGRELAAHLKPVESAEARKVVKALVGTLIGSYPQAQRVSKDDADGALEVYINALIDLPLWAVKAACEGWIRGEGDGNSAFPPSASEIRVLASRKQIPFRQEFEKIRRILEAKVRKEPTAEERARAAARIDDVLKGLAAPREEASPHAAPLHAGARPASAPPSPATSTPASPPNISPSLRAKLGIQQAQGA